MFSFRPILCKSRAVLLLCCMITFVHSFTIKNGSIRLSNENKLGPVFMGSEESAEVTEAAEQPPEMKSRLLDVVVFGVGDLRVDDHGGLIRALERSEKQGSSILPAVLLDQKSLSCIPGAVAHTEDTARLVSEAVKDLSKNLKDMGLELSVVFGQESTTSALDNILGPLKKDYDEIILHACDLGDADNDMNYGPFSSLKDMEDDKIQVQSWTCQLWSKAWKSVESLPSSYPDFSKLDIVKQRDSPMPCNIKNTVDVGLKLASMNDLPSPDAVSETLKRILNLDSKRCALEVNTGMFETHWGGLEATSVGESSVLRTLSTYIDDCRENDETMAKFPVECVRNIRSLEHATMAWNMRGTGSGKVAQSNNLIAGERMTRYLAAPLLLGTVSPRRVWHMAKREPSLFQNPLKTLVETREWHKLLAAKNIRTDGAYQGKEALSYKYFRWHGYLCRYAESTMSSSPKSEKEGVLLVHGFGASSTQWGKLVTALTEQIDPDTYMEALVPDLLGFGQSEKPPITYSGYIWESYIGDFIKEVAIGKNDWGSFVIGGNSIGGFTCMSSAANDATLDDNAVSGSGSPGTGKCTGAILMNPAGVIRSKEEIEKVVEGNTDNLLIESVAQMTVTDCLPPCKPLPRHVARAFGTGLLSYLRPRIQSICKNLYPTNPGAVDEALCSNILRDSLDPGAINVMISGSKLPPSRPYNELLAADFGQGNDPSIKESQFRGPVLMPQGVLDPLNDANGRAEMLGTLRQGITIDKLQGGHCVHDEIPEATAESIRKWMISTKEERKYSLEKRSRSVGEVEDALVS